MEITYRRVISSGLKFINIYVNGRKSAWRIHQDLILETWRVEERTISRDGVECPTLQMAKVVGRGMAAADYIAQRSKS